MDAWGFLALVNEDDMWHAAAARVSAALEAERRRYVTTEWVLTEFLAGAAKPPFRQAAVRIVETWQTAGGAQVLPATHEDWLAAFELYKSRPDKEWSLVDCTSILLCQRLGITDVFTGDHHFEQAGLRVLLKR